MRSRRWFHRSARGFPDGARGFTYSARGFTYLEALAALALTALLMLGLMRTLGNVLDAHDLTRAHLDALEESRYAFERMVRAVSNSQRLLVPLAENPGTPHAESIRDPGVLVVTLDHIRDLDGNGIADADDDGDGRFDEDLPGDATYDGENGVIGIDDDGDGFVDESAGDKNDDEDDDGADEDSIDGLDGDGDGAIDEDPKADMNDDGEPGVAGRDDDGDTLIDEGDVDDDDEDGQKDEDWLNPVVFYQSGATLVERIPVPWDESGNGGVDGLDFIERTLVTNVVAFRVERIPAANGGPPLVKALLTTLDAAGESNTLETTILLGGGP